MTLIDYDYNLYIGKRIKLFNFTLKLSYYLEITMEIISIIQIIWYELKFQICRHFPTAPSSIFLKSSSIFIPKFANIATVDFMSYDFRSELRLEKIVAVLKT